jgi:hypothetical protein
VFHIVDIQVPPEDRRDEQLGSKRKFWFDRDDDAFLFKFARENEDWSEKVAEQCAEVLGLPHAQVELAFCEGLRGTVSRSFLEDQDRLSHGNEVLLQLDPTYPEAGRFYHVSQHTISAVGDALIRLDVKGYAFGNSVLPPDVTGEDEFVGHLLLDAWIANTDRHHQNWAVILRGQNRFLAPTFDHASSLGRSEETANMKERLAGKQRQMTVEKYVVRGRSALFKTIEDPKPLPLLAAFEAFGARRPEAARFWLERLKQVTDKQAEGILDQVPGTLISGTHRKFACAILARNRARLLASELNK